LKKNGESYMTNIKKSKHKKKTILRVKTGSVEEFFSTVGSVMRSADRKEPIKPKIKTLIFEDPFEMFHYLSKSKIILINRIRKRPDSIKNLAKDTHRNITAITRDINELEEVGIVRSHSIINPGHGRHKIIELTASELKLEVSI
jgi:predicted transcriptional regulator